MNGKLQGLSAFLPWLCGSSLMQRQTFTVSNCAGAMWLLRICAGSDPIAPGQSSGWRHWTWKGDQATREVPGTFRLDRSAWRAPFDTSYGDAVVHWWQFKHFFYPKNWRQNYNFKNLPCLISLSDKFFVFFRLLRLMIKTALKFRMRWMPYWSGRGERLKHR